MEQKAEQFRAQSKKANQGRPRHGWRYRRDLRQLAVLYFEACLRRGGSRSAAARSLGVSEVTLKRWQKGLKRKRSLRRVEVVEESANALVFVTPEGYRVEGLSEESLVRLLGQLR
jgi:DNA invertase Pin-like site-specific DNA recombinase